jgi:translation initiation factor IF-1
VAGQPADGGRGAAVEVDGTVLAVLPRALYRIGIAGEREVIAHAAAGPGRNFVRLVVGDRVVVALSGRDSGRGRVLRRRPAR